MIALDLLLAIPSGMVTVAYFCRLDGLRFKQHKLKVILFHVALMASAAACGFSAMAGTISLQDTLGLVAATAWLWISIPSWRYGPPSHVTKPMPLDPFDWRSVHGGKDSE